MQNLKYQLNKAKKPVTNFVTKVPECYHNFLDVFLKKNLDKIGLHSKYDYKIKLLNGGKDHKQTTLCGMSKPQLDFVKQFSEKNFKKALLRLAELHVSC